MLSVCMYPPLSTFESMKQSLRNHGIWTHFIGVLHKTLLPVCVSMCTLLSSLQNDLVNTSPRQRIHATIEELLEASFPIRSVSYEGRIRGSVFSILSSFFSCDYSRNPLKQMTDLPAPVGAHPPPLPPLVISHRLSWERNPSDISVPYFTMNPSENQ
jgi:hypothetical protein